MNDEQSFHAFNVSQKEKKKKRNAYKMPKTINIKTFYISTESQKTEIAHIF